MFEMCDDGRCRVMLRAHLQRYLEASRPIRSSRMIHSTSRKQFGAISSIRNIELIFFSQHS
jgi:hypothetical protein